MYCHKLGFTIVLSPWAEEVGLVEEAVVIVLEDVISGVVLGKVVEPNSVSVLVDNG